MGVVATPWTPWDRIDLGEVWMVQGKELGSGVSIEPMCVCV